jgi:hypothetical protein
VIRGALRASVALAMAAGACVPDTTSGSDAGAQTVLEQCTAIYTELCQQAISRCDLMGFTLNDCVTNNVDTCCTGSVCNETSLSSAAAVNACTAAIDAEDCYSLSTNATPSACQGLPQKP